MQFCFPNISTDGEYNYLSQTIQLNKLELSHLECIKKMNLDLQSYRHYKTIIHEATHYLDNISTIRGLQLLQKGYNSIHALDSFDVNEYWKIIEYKNAISKVFHNDYYKIIDSSVSDTDISKWYFDSSVGLRFNSKGKIREENPILFTSFKYNNERVARIPLALETLWECNAMSSEIMTFNGLLNETDSEVDKKIEEDRFVNDLVLYLYNSSMLEYSSAAHYVSKHLVIDGNVYTSYRLMRILSGICSNMPDECMNGMKMPEIFKYDRFNQIRYKHLLKNHDVGYLFLCLLYNLTEKIDVSVYDYSKFSDKEIGELFLKASNLPENKILNATIKRNIINMKKDKSKNQGTYSNEVREIFDKGLSIFELRGIFNENNEKLLNKDNLFNYPIITVDDMESIQYIKALKLHNYEKRILDFVKACNY